MQEPQFNENAAKEHLQRKELEKAAERETSRLHLLQQTQRILQQELQGRDIEVWIIGSLIRPNKFTKFSDVDIVVKNYSGDRFELWTHLEALIGRDIEIIRYEECNFQEDIKNNGLKVL